MFIVLMSAVLNVRSSTSATDGATPAALQPGAPSGSYALSGFDNINLYNGNLNFRLPLAAIIGRGEIGTAVTMPLERKWRVMALQFPQPDGSVNYVYTPIASFWKTLPVLYNPGGLEGRQAGYDITTCPDNTTVYTQTLTRLTFTTADGTEYELRDTLTNGRPASNGGCNYLNPQSRGTVFISADGTGATFTSDQTIYDQVIAPGGGEFRPSGYLMLSDGTKYRIDAGRITWARDRNGNKITYDYDANNRVIAITDSLKRVLNITYASGGITYDELSFKGYNGATRTIRVNYASMSTVLQSGTIQTFRQLFPELLGGSQTTTFNPTVVASVTLPNNRQYEFRYNVYGELVRVVLPTGGAYEYDYAGADSTSGTTCCGIDGSPNIARRVVERRVYSDGSTGSSYESKMTYSITTGTPATYVYVLVKNYKQGDPNPIAQQRHYFYGLPLSSFGNYPTDYSAWNEGKEYQTESLTANGAFVLKREVHTFQNRAAVSWWPGNFISNNTLEPPNDPRVTQTLTTLEPSGQNLVSKVTYGYDDSVTFNNRNNVKEYDFGVGSPAELLRETRTTYVTSSSYTGTSVHLRSLVSQVSVYDGSGVERSRTNAEFDSYTTDANHAPLANCPNISGFDSSFNTSYVTRGNVTCSTRSILVNGVVTGSVTSCRQFDIAGNAVKTINARGFAVTTEYSDRFGSPDGDARANSAPAELAGLTSYAFPTKITNALGQTAYAQFDYYLSQPVDAEDTNGIVTSGYFNDVLDRPTQVRRAVGTAIQSQTTFVYDETARSIRTTRDQVTNGDNVLVTKLFYDKLGRTEEDRQYEGGSNYIAIRTQYDALGRPYMTSNPFRPLQNESLVWTTQLFDSLGRVISVTYPDSAVVSTSYEANAITVTDPKLRKRKSIMDALGRMKHVYEDPNGLNYLTSYSYDVFNNLASVTQGTQTRTFSYNSLNQLTSATNPENGTTSYQYDNEGNLVVKTDARSVSTHFAYDALNRPTRRWYNGSSSTGSTTHNSPALPSGVGAIDEVTFFYDSQSLPSGAPSFSRGSSIGRQVGITYGTGSSVGDYFGYDALGRTTLKIQRTGSVNYQMSAAYNLAGDTTGITYPSGHTATYVYDAAGRTSSFSGSLGDGTTRTYASTFVYNPAGQTTQELFGTATPLYHKLQYNIRSQLWDVRVSTGSDINGSWNRGCLQYFYDGTYGYGTSGPDNNGNLLFANTYIPLDEQIVGWAIHRQSYNYDSLNRLTSTTEYFVSNTQAEAQQSIQSYSYPDRWGNRIINTGGTNGTGINNKVFTINTANNQLGVPAGQSGAISYDAAGNLTNDTYSGAGNRTYDAENRITSAWGGNNQAQLYGYDASNQRVTRTVNGVTTWQVYGPNAELIAEYAANSAASSPQKEYGYRGGQLLITADAGPSGLVGYWKFNENSGTTAADSSGNSNTGTLTSGATWGVGQSGAATSLDGSDDYVQVGPQASLAITSAGTFSAWIYPTGAGSLGTYGGIIVNKEGEYEVARFADGTIQWAFANTNPGWNWINSGYVAPLNQWTHVALVYDSGVVKTYINGVLTHTYNGSGSIGDIDGSQNDFRIGGRQSASHNFQGRIDEVKVYNRALSATEVSTTSGQTCWLVTDHLGTPRMVIDQTGSLANVKRHDYLPFGEELFAGTGGRTAAQGYSPGDGVRQQFTSQERDVETGLDYFGARYYSSIQGRFTGSDPGKFTPADPQNFNRYSYVQNNPLKFIDPTGRDLYLTGSDADYIVAELERITGLKLQRDKLTGKVTIVPGSKRNANGTSTWFANRLSQVIGDSRAKVEINTTRSRPGEFIDSYLLSEIDVDDYNAFKKADPKFAAAALAHVIEEYYYEQIIPYAGTNDPGWKPAGDSRGPLNKLGRFAESHEAALEFESNVLSDFTGWWEKPREGHRVEIPPSGSRHFYRTEEYSTVTYDVIEKNGTVQSVNKYEKRKPIKH